MEKDTPKYLQTVNEVKRRAIKTASDSLDFSGLNRESRDQYKAERYEAYKKLKRERNLSLGGKISNLSRQGHLRAEHISNDGNIDIDALRKSEYFNDTRDPAKQKLLTVLEGHQLSVKSKLRQESITKSNVYPLQNNAQEKSISTLKYDADIKVTDTPREVVSDDISKTYVDKTKKIDKQPKKRGVFKALRAAALSVLLLAAAKPVAEAQITPDPKVTAANTIEEVQKTDQAEKRDIITVTAKRGDSVWRWAWRKYCTTQTEIKNTNLSVPGSKKPYCRFHS